MSDAGLAIHLIMKTEKSVNLTDDVIMDSAFAFQRLPRSCQAHSSACGSS